MTSANFSDVVFEFPFRNFAVLNLQIILQFLNLLVTWWR